MQLLEERRMCTVRFIWGKVNKMTVVKSYTVREGAKKFMVDFLTVFVSHTNLKIFRFFVHSTVYFKDIQLLYFIEIWLQKGYFEISYQ